ncbi:hypothetical protein P3342_006476 [Pyrenophora teres f. teres]|nr:hypothetical protein P3342_006476 [Pyrenophora teres f. teres]
MRSLRFPICSRRGLGNPVRHGYGSPMVDLQAAGQPLQGMLASAAAVVVGGHGGAMWATSQTPDAPKHQQLRQCCGRGPMAHGPRRDSNICPLFPPLRKRQLAKSAPRLHSGQMSQVAEPGTPPLTQPALAGSVRARH